MKLRLASLLLLFGCASPGTRIYDKPRVVSVLTVNNQRGENAAIYVVHSGLRGRRLGEVTSFGSATFLLTPSDAPAASDVQFLARAMVTGTMELSDPIPAMYGANYEWKLGPGRNYEFLALRSVSR